MAREKEKCQHPPKPVATLILFARESVDVPFQESEQSMEIFPRDKFYFGRGQSCTFKCADQTVSNKHLHIHCIVYEDDEASGIPPLVYVEDLSTNGTFLTRARHTTEERITRGQNGIILLTHGDQIRVSPTMSFLFSSNCLIPLGKEGIVLNELQRREAQLFQDRFEITDQVLGFGGYGSVFAAIHKNSNRQLACKVIEIEPSSPSTSMKLSEALKDIISSRKMNNGIIEIEREAENIRSLNKQRSRIRDSPQFREFEILKDLDHPNIIRLEKVFWSVNNLYIFQELVTGGDLFSYIESKGGRLHDIEAAVILRQVLKAIQYLHERDIVHRDLKPDNILITSTAEGARIVVTDFGNARYFPENLAQLHHLPAKKRRMFTIAGTMEYVAPEIHSMNPFVPKSQGYSKAVDMWSVGVIAAALLTGDSIFVNRADPRFKTEPRLILSLAAKCDLSMLDDPYTVWRTVGRRPKDFVKKLLVLDEFKRMTATQALAHDWFTNKHYADELDAVYQRSIRFWNPRRKIFRLIEALDTSKLLKNKYENDHHDGSTSRHFPLAASYRCQSRRFKPDRKTIQASLPKIDEEPPTELQQTTTSVSHVKMTQYPDAQDPYYPDSFDVQHSMRLLDISASEAATHSQTDENDIFNDRRYDLNATHQRAPNCTKDYNGPLPSLLSLKNVLGTDATADTQLNDRKRPSSSKSEIPDHIDNIKKGGESFKKLDHVRHIAAKRARMA